MNTQKVNARLRISCMAICLMATANSPLCGAIKLSNLSLATDAGQLLSLGSGIDSWAQAFMTGDEGALITTATISIGTPLTNSSGTATVSIFADGVSAPLDNGSLGSFSDITPGVISSEGDYSWTSNAGIELEANTQYWLAVEGDGSPNIRWAFRNIVPPAVTFAESGWGLVEDRSSSSNSGVTWNDLTFNNGQFVFALESAAIPEPHHTAALVGVALFSITCVMRRRRQLQGSV